MKRTASPAPSQAEFEASDAINEALAATPDVRAAKVDRARDLAASAKYPPTELIDGLSNLLARNLRSE